MSEALAGWTARPFPGEEAIRGRTVLVEPITDERRFDELFAAFKGDDAMWRWLAYGPFADQDTFREFAEQTYLAGDQCFHAIVPLATGRAEGVASLMRVDQANGSIEIGNIALAGSLRGTVATTEMQYLLMSRVFDELGYRRYEWKCNARNEPSRRTAARLGFRYEGTFRQHLVVKGENRDTDWFSVIDSEWPTLKAAFEGWLASDNHDRQGQQRQRLEAFRPA